MNELQQDAINEFGLLDGDHLVVSAPTSSGKTLVGELAALKGVLERKRALFLLPMKALVNDKYAEFTSKYEAFGLRTIRATGDINDDVPALMRGQYDVCLMTYEKCAALVLAQPHILNDVGTVVVDEVQMIIDQTRGANLEFLLTLHPCPAAARYRAADRRAVGGDRRLERARALARTRACCAGRSGRFRSTRASSATTGASDTSPPRGGNEKTEPLITPVGRGGRRARTGSSRSSRSSSARGRA